jgi:chromosome segregation ATPase
LKDEIEKFRKSMKDADRQKSEFKKYRADYEVMRATEKKNKEELTINHEKIKALKADKDRKDNYLKEAREKIERLTNDIEKNTSNDEELIKLKLKVFPPTLTQLAKTDQDRFRP